MTTPPSEHQQQERQRQQQERQPSSPEDATAQQQQQLVARQAPPQEMTPAQRDEWRAWFAAQLIRAGYAHYIPGRTVEYHVAPLSRATGVSRSTLNSLIYQDRIPSPPTLRALAHVLGLNPLALAVRCGHLPWEAVMPLLGPAPAYLRNTEDYRQALEEAAAMVADPAFLARVQTLIHREWRYLAWLERARTLLAISDVKWQDWLAEQQTIEGRERLRDDLFSHAHASDPDAFEQMLPAEFRDHAGPSLDDLPLARSHLYPSPRGRMPLPRTWQPDDAMTPPDAALPVIEDDEDDGESGDL